MTSAGDERERESPNALLKTFSANAEFVRSAFSKSAGEENECVPTSGAEPVFLSINPCKARVAASVMTAPLFIKSRAASKPFVDAGNVFRAWGADYYTPLFTDAFGDANVTSERISLALAQFVRSIVSFSSPWDDAVTTSNGDISADFPGYSSAKNRGKDIFFGQHDTTTHGLCGTCHLANNPLAFAPPGPGGMGPSLENVAICILFAQPIMVFSTRATME
ncbi:MAG: hypothetical protein GY822_21825 [Deltaproteobacteria bacterium]|nr:hypothetical protein [Deltaproteobacteria bacterium]